MQPSATDHFLLILHATIAGVMLIKCWCDRERLNLTAPACALSGSALLMLGTLSRFPGGLMCGTCLCANANDALIFYCFRNIILMILFTVGIVLYYFRHSPQLTAGTHIVILTACLSVTGVIITLSRLYSSHYPLRISLWSII
ncbi:TPA: MASE4 domain-containing protein [Raoultella planticola]